MYLSELFDQLSYGELAQTHIGGGSEQGVGQQHYSNIITHVNLGLIEIYKRFAIKQGTVVIQQIPAFTTYKLDARYAKSNPYNTDDYLYPKYIIDTEHHPFLDDVLVIEAVSDELGRWYSLNDESCPDTAITVGGNIIQLPFPSVEAAMFIHYRAKPEKVELVEGEDPRDVYVELPPQFNEALLAYVAHRIFMGQSSSPEAQMYYQKFLQSCDLIERYGIFNQDELYNTRQRCQQWP